MTCAAWICLGHPNPSLGVSDPYIERSSVAVLLLLFFSFFFFFLFLRVNNVDLL